jgi:2-keto-4-pentenoate hydratase
MPIGMEAEATQGYEEARSVLGSLITQLIAVVRQIIGWVIGVVNRIVEWSGSHPLAMLLLTANMCIWVS